ncbi:hypothetical protein QBL02_07715 [Leucobacter sp. UT-8R-CII-1-4]|uniref:hypothetical protein n=1 Tax=Leucobacter sp. UT-8R-CII-1-4 TaxID=3040075 RepID=UPI0024A8F5ED|nr:hypothetical protein [Leucobacter sp. UT-8R-CII-1-4]MDI6023430.1 hypothetical protein [Leucobacter sp. UT-8R-CII-1-4]
MTRAIRLFIALLVLGAVTVATFVILSGLNYAELDQRSLEAPTPTWILVGMAVGAAITAISLIGLIAALVKGKAARS